MRVVNLSLVSGALAATTRHAALEKVIVMLNEMEVKNKSDMQAEEVNFAKYTQFMENEINKAEAQMEAAKKAKVKYQAKMDKMSETSKAAKNAKDEAQKTVELGKADIVAMDKQRKDEREAFEKKKLELSDGLYACEKAIAGLSAMKDVKGSTFLQLKNSLKKFPGHSLAKTLMMQVEALSDEPFTTAHEAKSGAIVEMVRSLKEEFTKNLQDFTTAETERDHSYRMKTNETTHKITNAEEKAMSKNAEQGNAEAEYGSAKAARSAAEADLADATQRNRDLKSELQTKTNVYNQRMKSRGDELNAIAQAISILSSGSMQAADANLDAASKVLLQIRSKQDGNNEKVVEFLRSQADSLHSDILMQLSSALEADPFAKVKAMISQLLAKLEKEAAEEAAKHGDCMARMMRDKKAIANHSADVNKYSAQVEMQEGKLAEAREQILERQNEITDNEAAVSKAKETRVTESAENKRVEQESDAGIKALDSAVTVLQDYYSKAALLQQPTAPSEAYTGADSGSGGVLAMLDVILTDMKQLKEETVADEESSAQAHAQFLNDMEMAHKLASAELRSQKEKEAQAKADLSQAQEDRANAKKNLGTAEGIKAVTDDDCIAKGQSHEEKVAHREEEMQSLQEALKILQENE